MDWFLKLEFIKGFFKFFEIWTGSASIRLNQVWGMKKVIDYLKNENSSIIGECNKILNYLDGLKKSYKRATYRRPKLTIQQMVAQSYWFDAKELVVFTIYHLRKLEQLMEMYTDGDNEELCLKLPKKRRKLLHWCTKIYHSKVASF